MSGCEFCGVEDLNTWRHAEKTPTSHAIWTRTDDGFTLGVTVHLDPYGKLCTWEVQRTGNPSHSASGACGHARSGLWLALASLERWRETLARAARPVRLPLPAAVEEVPF